MKKLLLNVTLIIALGYSANAQEKKEPADFAHWVVESNIKTPRQAMVKFYNEKQEVIYQERIDKKINISRPKVQKALNDVMKQLLAKTFKASDTNIVLTAASKW